MLKICTGENKILPLLPGVTRFEHVLNEAAFKDFKNIF